MDSNYFPTHAITDLTSGGTALKHKKTIILNWSIKDFSYFNWKKFANGETLCGPDFKFHPLSKELWKLEIHRRLDIYVKYDYSFSINIRKLCESESTALEFVISWSANSNLGSKFLQREMIFPATTRAHELFDSEMNNFLRLSLNKGDRYIDMVIQIESNDDARGSANSGACDVETPDFQSSLNKGKLAVLADMESILKKAEFADISLISEGKEIRANRDILAGRSVVFQRMFHNQMSENASGLVDISDVTYDTLQRLVCYMYFARLVDLDVKSASELFVASDKYSVQDLHETCSLFLKGSLTAENCLEILLLADTHSNKELKNSAVKYFTRHSKEICQDPDWKTEIETRPSINLELLLAFALSIK